MAAEASSKNKDLVRKLEETYESGTLDELASFFTTDFVGHNMVPGMPSDSETIKMIHRMSVSAMPDRKVTIEDIVAEGDKVVTRCRVQGTNSGGFPAYGAEANNAKVDFEFISIYRVKDGKLAEHWGIIDGEALLRQLGVWAPPMPPA
jgi:predicted ester cyclase